MLDESYDNSFGKSETPASETFMEIPTSYSARLPLHGRLKKFVEWRFFRGALYAAVIISAACMGLEVERPSYSNLWLRVDMGVTFLYSCDCTLKLYVYGHNYLFMRGNTKKPNLWNVGDLSVTMASVLYLGLERTNLGNEYKATSQLVKMARILRIFRLFLLRRELVLIIEGFVASVISMFWVFVVLAVMTYAFAIFCANMIGQADYSSYKAGFDNKQLFGSVPRSMLTLFSILIVSEWDSVVRPLYEVQPVLVPFFVAFTIFVTFGMMNVVVGILVETVADVQKKHRKKALDAEKRAQCELFQRMVSHMANKTITDRISEGRQTESDEDLGITQSEFVAFARERQEFKDAYQRIDFPHGFTSEDLYIMLDESGDGLMTPKEFTCGMFRLVHGNEFQRACILQQTLHKFKRLVAHQQVQLALKVQQAASAFAEERQFKAAEQAAAEAAAAKGGSGPEVDIKIEYASQAGRRLPANAQSEYSRQATGKEDIVTRGESHPGDDSGDPLRAATLRHCQAEVAKARKDVQVKGKAGGLPAGIRLPESGTFSKKEENFLVRTKLLEAVTNASAEDMRKWLFHAQNIGIHENELGLEYAYGAKLVKKKHGCMGIFSTSRECVGPWRVGCCY